MKKKVFLKKRKEESSLNGARFLLKKRRTKSDWAGIHLSDAFKPNLDFYIRIPAQRLFYKAVKKAQFAAAGLAGMDVQAGFKPEAKPQLSPCYTTYPSALAAYAAIGLTAFLEFHIHARTDLLESHFYEHLDECAFAGGWDFSPARYERVSGYVISAVHRRLLLEDLGRSPSMSAVEIYRLFAACQQKLNFRTISEILNAVVLYGDVFPAINEVPLHPLTRAMLTDLSEVSRPFFHQLPLTESTSLLELGAAWVKAICDCLADYLESCFENENDPDKKKPDATRGQAGIRNASNKMIENGTSENECHIPPLNKPQPPALDEPLPLDRQIMHSIPSFGADFPAIEESLHTSLKRFMDHIAGAGGQRNEFEDMRSDLLEKVLGSAPFQQGPIEGNPTEGHEVRIEFGNENAAAGEIYDRAIELSDDLYACNKLMEESQPVIEVLKEILYPNISELPETERYLSSGSLDPARLAISPFSSTVFQRYRIRQTGDRRGRPVLLIACDGSGSLSAAQMKMAKVLAASWLNASARRNVQMLAGFYHSKESGGNGAGPLVQWVYHPRKTVCIGPNDATRALLSLPDCGTGVQSDVLSIAFMLEEARQLARGKMVYLILITDCLWNRSFQTATTGDEEVYSFFQNLYTNPDRKIHITMVALGSASKDFEQLLDKVIIVSADQLRDSAGVAAQIGKYVASVMKERGHHAKRKR